MNRQKWLVGMFLSFLFIGFAFVIGITLVTGNRHEPPPASNDPVVLNKGNETFPALPEKHEKLSSVKSDPVTSNKGNEASPALLTVAGDVNSDWLFAKFEASV